MLSLHLVEECACRARRPLPCDLEMANFCMQAQFRLVQYKNDSAECEGRQAFDEGGSDNEGQHLH